jgi:hypothetical protein
VPPELNAICLKCLEKKPADRYQSAAELAEALEAWPASPHHERTVAAPRGAVTPPVRAASPRRRAVWPGRRGPLALAAGLVLAVGAVAAIEAARRADEYGRLDWERFNRVPTDGDRGWSDADGKNGRSDPLQTRLAAVAAAESHIARELRYAEQYLAAEPAALRPGGRERIEQYRTWLNDTMHEVRRARQGAIQGVDRALPPLPPAFAFHEWAVYVEPLGWEHGFGGANGMVNLEVQPGVWVKAFSAANYPRVAFPGRALIEPGSVRLVLRRPDQPDAVELKRFDAAALRDCHEMKATNGYIKTPQNPVTPCRHYDDVFDRVPVHDFTPGRKPVAVHSAAEKAFRESADYAPAAAAYKARMWATIYDFEYAWEFTDVRGLKFTLPHQNAAKWANWHPKMKPILNVTVPDGVGHDNNRPLEGAALQRHLRVPAGERAKPENWVDGVVR